MIFEYAIPIMIFTLVINWRNRGGRQIAWIFLLTSILFSWIIGQSVWIESYVLYAINELVMIHFVYKSRASDNLVRDMITISVASILVQLFAGLIMWVESYDSSIYMMACQTIFILQVIRLTAHGLATRKAGDTRGGSLDSLYSDNSGKKL